jgi:hypothetical protein
MKTMEFRAHAAFFLRPHWQRKTALLHGAGLLRAYKPSAVQGVTRHRLHRRLSEFQRSDGPRVRRHVAELEELPIFDGDRKPAG